MKCVLVGYGYWGRNVLQTLLCPKGNAQFEKTDSSQHTPSTPILAPYTQTPLAPAHFDIIGFCDSNLAQAQAALEDYARLRTRQGQPKSATPPRIYADFDSVCADSEVEAVFLITPPHTHFSLACQALESGKHCFVEKPLATSSVQCAKLQQYAADSAVVLHCDHIFLYAPAVQYLRAHIHELGEILHISARRANLGRFQRDVSVVWDLALHDLAILDYVLGDAFRGARFSKAHVVEHAGFDAIADIYGDLGGIESCPKHDSHSFASIAIHASWLSPIKVRSLFLSGSKASALYDEMNPAGKLAIFPYEYDLCDRAIDINGMSAPTMHNPALDSRMSALEASIADFALQISAGRARQELSSHTLRVASVLEQISQA